MSADPAKWIDDFPKLSHTYREFVVRRVLAVTGKEFSDRLDRFIGIIATKSFDSVEADILRGLKEVLSTRTGVTPPKQWRDQFFG